MLTIAMYGEEIDKKVVRLKILELETNIWIMDHVLDKALDYRDVIREFVKSKIHFVIIGGFAAVAHGVVRVTMDIDFAIQCQHDDLKNAWDILYRLGFKVRQPIQKSEFTNPKTLMSLARAKNLQAVSFFHKDQPFLVVDILFKEEFQFTDKDIVSLNLFGLKCPVASIERLVKMKKRAGRKKDLEDVKELEKIKKK